MAPIFMGEPPEAIARSLAMKGAAAVEQMQSIVDLARRMLVRNEVIASESQLGLVQPYDWEVDDDPPPDGRAGVWLASVSDYATGEGMSVYVLAGFAVSENAFRRRIAAEVGRELADCALVRPGASGSVPYATMLISPSFRSTLEAFDRGEQRPVAMSFVARYRANYS